MDSWKSLPLSNGKNLENSLSDKMAQRKMQSLIFEKPSTKLPN